MKPTDTKFHIEPVTQQDLIDATETARRLRAEAMSALWSRAFARLTALAHLRRPVLRHS